MTTALAEAAPIGRLVKVNGPAITVDQDATILSAAQKMTRHEIGALVVTDRAGRVAGIITERDILAKVASKGLDSYTHQVRDIMTKDVVWATTQTSLEQARRIMAQQGIRHLPIVDHDRPVGMVSSRDVLALELEAARHVARTGTRVLQQLENQHPGITRLKTDQTGRIVI